MKKTFRLTIYRLDPSKYLALCALHDDRITIEFQAESETTPTVKPLEEMKEDAAKL